MKTRQEVEAEYIIDANGIVRSPGKFEAEPWWVVALWDLVLDGAADGAVSDGDADVDFFKISDELTAEIPDLAEYLGQWICVWQTGQGFVESAVVDSEPQDSGDYCTDGD